MTMKVLGQKDPDVLNSIQLEIVRQAFKMTRLDVVFEFYDNEAAALAS